LVIETPFLDVRTPLIVSSLISRAGRLVGIISRAVIFDEISGRIFSAGEKLTLFPCRMISYRDRARPRRRTFGASQGQDFSPAKAAKRKT
jgi:hypothetical protein